jgi:hypothetical protein
MSPSTPHPTHGQLRIDLIRTTIAQLEHRISTRFPGSGLSQLGNELIQLAAEIEPRINYLRRPLWWLRALIALAMFGVIALSFWSTLHFLKIATGESTNMAELLQGVDAAINELILLSLALLFLVSTENRLKRRHALRLLHRLRSIAHVVDMHQLTKDPDFALHPQPTSASPTRALKGFQLARYLDYCSEMLALISKLAALHTQYLQDPVVLGAVKDIEALTAGLSSKIWQKIMILDISATAAQAMTATAEPRDPGIQRNTHP